MRVAATIVAMLFALTACSSHDTVQEVRPAPRRAPNAASSTLPREPESTAAPAPTSVPASTSASTFPSRVATAYAVRARNSTIAVYPAPNAKYWPRLLPNPWVVDPARPGSKAPQVFLVQRSKEVPGWWRVLLPVQPNGSTGWVRWRDVSIEPITYRVRVNLDAHRITVFKGNDVVDEGPIAIGKASTPTPTGKYYIRALIRAPNPSTAYGPYAYGLASRSRDMPNFTGGDGEIGIHGNSDPAVLGHSVTGGAIRVDNDTITRLAGILPLGTPVDVVA